LATIGKKVDGQELVSIALNGLTPSWMPFDQGVCACETLPNIAKLWDKLVQEKIVKFLIKIMYQGKCFSSLGA
jgi:hypothetical protein